MPIHELACIGALSYLLLVYNEHRGYMELATTVKVSQAPLRPVMVPGYRIIHLPDGTVILRRQDHIFTLRGRSVPLLLQLIDLMDGTRDSLELADQLHVDPRVIAQLLTRLQNANVLVEKDDLLDCEDAHFGIASLLSRVRFGNQQYSHEVYKDLKKQVVGVCGSSDLVRKVSDQLSASGVGRVRCGDLASFEDGPESPPSFLIHAEYLPDYRTALKANGLALRSGIPWVAGWFSGTTMFVTHVMHPAENACFECLLLRQRANYLNIKEDLAYEHTLRDTSPDLSIQETTPSMEYLLTACIAMRALSSMVGVPSPRFLEIAIPELTTIHHPVLRLPRCPACGPMTLQPKTNPYADLPGPAAREGEDR